MTNIWQKIDIKTDGLFCGECEYCDGSPDTWYACHFYGLALDIKMIEEDEYVKPLRLPSCLDKEKASKLIDLKLELADTAIRVDGIIDTAEPAFYVGTEHMEELINQIEWLENGK